MNSTFVRRRAESAQRTGAPPKKAETVSRKDLRKYSADFLIVLLTLLLVVIGLVVVYDASYYQAQRDSGMGNDPAYFLKKQLYGAILGFAAMFVFSRNLIVKKKLFDYTIWRLFMPPVLILSFILLGVVLVIGREANEASRWITVAGVSVQPSEIGKFGLILFLAHMLTNKADCMGSFWKTVFPALAMTGALCVLLILEPNYSMTMTYIAVAVAMLWLAGAKPGQLLTLIFFGVAVIAVAYKFVPYVHDRIAIFMNPESDASGDGYQILQSLYAIAGGGFSGVGMGNSLQKYGYLPYRESDFIFSIYAEEFGFIGCIVLLALYWLLIWRCILVAVRCPDRFGKLVTGGITSALAIQVILNVLVVTGSMPPTGLPLPFISAGGTSLAIFLGEIGIVLNVSRRSRTHVRA